MPGFPENSGPAWLGCLMYGRLALVFFLVLSHRRAWRILPPYWAALALSLAVAWFVVPASHFGPPTGTSMLVYGFVVQDIFTAPTPNGAFWSIGVEAELYLVFPLLLLVRRRLGAGIVVAPERIRRLPWHWLAALAALPVVALVKRNRSWKSMFSAGRVLTRQHSSR